MTAFYDRWPFLGPNFWFEVQTKISVLKRIICQDKNESHYNNRLHCGTNQKWKWLYLRLHNTCVCCFGTLKGHSTYQKSSAWVVRRRRYNHFHFWFFQQYSRFFYVTVFFKNASKFLLRIFRNLHKNSRIQVGIRVVIAVRTKISMQWLPESLTRIWGFLYGFFFINFLLRILKKYHQNNFYKFYEQIGDAGHFFDFRPHQGTDEVRFSKN